MKIQLTRSGITEITIPPRSINYISFPPASPLKRALIQQLSYPMFSWFGDNEITGKFGSNNNFSAVRLIRSPFTITVDSKSPLFRRVPESGARSAINCGILSSLGLVDDFVLLASTLMAPFCERCGILTERLDLKSALSDINKADLLVVAIPVTEQKLPNNISLSDYLEMLGSERVIVNKKVFSKDNKSLQDLLSRSLSDLPKDHLKAILYSCSLPCSSEERVQIERVTNEYIDIGEGQIDIDIFSGNSDLISSSRVASGYICPSCKSGFTALSSEKIFGEVEDASCKSCNSTINPNCGYCKGTGLVAEVLYSGVGDFSFSDLILGKVSSIIDWLSVAQIVSDYELYAKERLIAGIEAILRVSLGSKSITDRLSEYSLAELFQSILARLMFLKLTDVVIFFDTPQHLISLTSDSIRGSFKQLAEQGNSIVVLGSEINLEGEYDQVIVIEDKGAEIILNVEKVSSHKSKIDKDGLIDATEFLKLLDSGGLESLKRKVTKITDLSIRAVQDLVKKDENSFDNIYFIPDDTPGKHESVASYAGVYPLIVGEVIKSGYALSKGVTANDLSFAKGRFRCQQCDGVGCVAIVHDRMSSPKVNKDLFSNVCSVCDGERLSSDFPTLEYRGVELRRLLKTTVRASLDIFRDDRVILHRLQCIIDAGLGELMLGEPFWSLGFGARSILEFSKLLRTYSTNDRINDLFVFEAPYWGISEDDAVNIEAFFNRVTIAGATIWIISATNVV